MARGRPLPKLELAPFWPALAAILVAAILLWALVPRAIQNGAAEQLGESVALLAPALADGVPDDPAALQERVLHLAEHGSLRITVIGPDGVVLADSERTRREVTRMDNHATRPEVAQALATGSGWSVRRSATTGVTYAYAARTFTGSDGGRYVLRLAEPLDELAAVESRLAGAMAVAALAALAVAGLVLAWLSLRFFRPLARLAEGAGELAAGDYSRRLLVPEEPHLAALGATLNRLASRVEEQIERVRAERDHLESIVRSMSDGVLVTDRQGRALLVNPELRRLFGIEGEVVGRAPLELIRLPELAEVIDGTLQRGESQTAVAELRLPERRTVALTSAVLAAPSQPGAGIEGVVVVARDTTQATRLDEMRRDFVANVSHELKTPLSAIRAYGETLRDGALDDRATAQRFVERILEQSHRLQDLLGDLLTLSRLESLEPRHEPSEVDLVAVARRAIELLAERARSRGVEVALETPDGPLAPILGDREGIERLFQNLLDNAVKYNREGGRVTARISCDPEHGGSVVIEVSDTGIGIPKAALPRIFERFYRVDKGRARGEGGTGLGLAIVKHVAQSAGGKVEVASELGTGTTVQVVIPLRERPAADVKGRTAG